MGLRDEGLGFRARPVLQVILHAPIQGVASFFPPSLVKALLRLRRLRVYLEGQGDLVSRLITPITHIVTLIF